MSVSEHPSIAPALSDLVPELQRRYDAFTALGLSLDMTRGKPSSAQLDLANAMLDLPGRDFTAGDRPDPRNTGRAEGLPEMKALFAEMLETTPANVIVGGNSSLQ